MSLSLDPKASVTGSDQRIERLFSDPTLDQASIDQMATDASRLATVARDRLAEFQGAGFFLRFWHGVTGKSAELNRMTVADLVEAQGLAWQYLAALQNRSLFSARAIAVVRNNLSHLADGQERLGALMLVQANRTGELARDVRAIEWRDVIRVRQDYLGLPEILRVLKAAFEYADKFGGRESAIERLEASHDLEIALSNLGVSPSRRTTLGELADAIVRASFESGTGPIEEITRIRVGDRAIDPAMASGIVAGMAFSGILSAAREIPIALRITESADEETRHALVKKAARAAMQEPDASYELIEICREIVASTVLLKALLSPEQEALSGSSIEAGQPRLTVDELIARNIPLRSHALLELDFLSGLPGPYVESLVFIAADGGLDPRQRSFLASIQRVLGTKVSLERLDEIIADPAAFDLGEFIGLLQQPALRNAWLVDATFMGCSSGALDPVARGRILGMTQALDMKLDETERLIGLSQVFATSTDANEIGKAAIRLAGSTSEWKTILDFRKVSLDGLLRATRSGHWDDLRNCLSISLEINDLYWDVGMSAGTFGDEGLVRGTLISLIRKNGNSKFNALAEKVEEFCTRARARVGEANGYLHAFGIDTVPIDEKVNRKAIKPDSRTEAANTEWNDHMTEALDQLRERLDAYDQALGLAIDRLDQLAGGKWA